MRRVAQISLFFQNITLQCYLLVTLRSAEWHKPIPISKINLKKHFITNNNVSFCWNITICWQVNHSTHFNQWAKCAEWLKSIYFPKYHLTVLSTGHFEKRGVAQTYFFSKVCFRVQFTGHFEWRREEQTFPIFKIVL